MKNKNLIKIGVVLHPLNINDFLSKFRPFYPFVSLVFAPFLPLVSPYFIKEFYSKLPPHIIFRTNLITVGDKKIQIIAVMCPLFPEQLVLNSQKATDKIIKSVKLLVNQGVSITTLAGFSSIVTNGGSAILSSLNCCVTSGNTLTAALTMKGIYKILDEKKLEIKNLKVAVIGATGDIGSICSKIFARQAKILVLCSRSIEKDVKFKKEIEGLRQENVCFTSEVETATLDADIVITATSAFGFLIKAENLKRNAIICDISMPPNFSIMNSGRDDVFIIEGGRASLTFFSRIKSRAWKSLFPNNSVYGCLAEAVALALDGQLRNFSTGKRQITEEKLNEILSIAERNGVLLSVNTKQTA